MTKSPHLFSPLNLRSTTTRNRIVISPMCQYSAHEGHLNDWHLVNLGRFATGGAGIVFTEATAVQKSGRITHGCAGLWDDGQISGHSRIAHFVANQGAIPAIQLGHAGRKSSSQRPWLGRGPLGEDDFKRGDMQWPPVAPSALPVDEDWPVPQALSKSEISKLVEDFAAAGRRALSAGYKIVEVHGAHGYLIHSFLSPISNKRSDAYGGDLAGRMRFAFEVTEAMRAVWPDDLPLFFRTSAVDGVKDGWSMDDTVKLASGLQALGVDVVDCSSMGISGPATAGGRQKIQPGYQVPFAERVKAECGLASMAVGLITHPEQANAIIAEGRADLVAIGREVLVDPNWPLNAAQTLGHDENYSTWPIQSGSWLARRQTSCDFYEPSGD